MLKKTLRLLRKLPAQIVVLSIVASGASYAENRSLPDIAERNMRAMIGQMLLVGFTGNRMSSAGMIKVLQQAATGKITGVIYLKRNIKDGKTVREMNAAFQEKSLIHPFLVAIDQEGGYIQRLTKASGFPNTQSARSVADHMDESVALELYSKLATNLRAWGFNLNLGPVVDLNINSLNPIIGRLDRSFSKDPETVIQYATAFVEGHRKNGVLTALKHFPGHGSSVGDSHKATVDVTTTWQRNELDPYRALIKSNEVDMVMSSHVINHRLDPTDGNLPSSLSKTTLTEILREELGFKGVVISDDLQMSAIAGTRSLHDYVIQAIIAGNDILVFANDKQPDSDIPDKVADILLQEALTNSVLRNRIIAASANVQRLKNDWAAKNLRDSIQTKSISYHLQYTLITKEYLAGLTRQEKLGVNWNGRG